MNYFSYFSEIEDTFIRRRSKHLLLSPLDWALIESWKERGIPLHVALRGIEHAFDSYEAKKRKRSVKTLLYCQEEVEAQFAEWLESRIGSHDEKEDSGDTEVGSPFPRDEIMAYLTRSLAQLHRVELQRSVATDDYLRETVLRVITRLEEIKNDYETAAQPVARKLEESLTGLERMLDEAISNTMSTAEIEKVLADVDLQLQPYKRHMEKTALARTRQTLLRKRLREHFDIPRLSLFFLTAG